MKYGKLFMMVLLSAMMVGALLAAVGCQAGVVVSTDAKLFYPDKVGKHDIGDPRKGMYDGSGFAEGQIAGSAGAPVKGFDGIGGE